ncbi:hypothetical protein NUU61_008520 [Penicillium alfredii]|uniref:Uncharacterized protein n=1 Tax=Penicillium alfredii TaxID=1506179 RepID=A0A9W9JWG9_9EURO|nr:uncharacterized protein NUU61_008520 [Penicillium alfredii]KAJ5083941.1 hypothetical protein NUU61_008520 [Penicillium alfredii]
MTTNSSVLITGCSDGGIGSGLALAFQERGYQVFATARNIDKMEALTGLPNVTLLTLDVVEPSHIDAAVKAVSAQTGGTLSYLINNAGRNHFMPILDETIETAREIFEINVWGPVAVTKAFAPLLIEAQGTLVNITSIAGHIPLPNMGSYAASKRSLEIISESLRLELTPFHVKVLSVVTGSVATNGQTYLQNWALPPDSRYKPIEQSIAQIVRGHDGIPRSPLTQYATEVVEQILAGAAGRIWCGERAATAKEPVEGAAADQRDRWVMQLWGLDDLSG